jgi:dTDP-4-amino-4,6-dideoxygalactose transaminase
MIPTSKPFLPPLAEYVGYLEGIWERAWLTNNGPLLLELEARLADFLGARHVVVTANGTLALQLAMRALEVDGEVICTPFSYVATASAPAWEGARVVMADVEAGRLTLDAAAAEEALTEATRALIATHVYGIPCDDDALRDLARRRGLKLIYDAAHAFGARYRGRSLCTLGDVSILSFHATKLFHSVEGGALVTEDEAVAARARSLRNFGHVTADRFGEPGINAKCSEFHAAMGLVLLPRVPDLIARRAAIAALYDSELAGLPVARPAAPSGTEPNHAYYPLLLPDEAAVLRLQPALAAINVQLRRYFHPSLGTLPYVRAGALPVAADAARRVVCLPLYPDLAPADASAIAATVRRVL